MFRPARQCVSRWTFRLALLAAIIIGGTWVLFSHTNQSYSLGCATSKECYEVLMTMARYVGDNSRQKVSAEVHQLERTPKIPDLSLPIDPPNLLSSDPEWLVHQEQGQDQSQEPTFLTVPKPLLSQEEQEYARLSDLSRPRVKAGYVVLVRNRELQALRSSMRYLEDRFNHKYNYPWIFLNEEPFTKEFVEMTQKMTKAETHYGLVPEQHWSYPEWINQTLARECRENMAKEGIMYGGSESYRHMCRFQSGFFYLHPLLDGLDYYWRVEPGVKFSCDIDYDPFQLMLERDIKYGFTIALEEYSATVPTLWKSTLEFMKTHPEHIYPRDRPDSLFSMVTDDDGQSYNLCHFWSNFEIASVKFMRSEKYQAYFRHLDRAGGFFYERWGDAPVHSIAVALMLSRKDIHWFYDIGYRHDTFEHCPTEPSWLVHGKCYCNPDTSFVKDAGSCTPKFLEVTNTTSYDYVVTRPDL
ncbi:nucleotide-diphospho-sugar transferase [Spinellus fusiger]|nr:nucleotide-diphospho-sugar transferase [Spinellus fusiger]